jgi:hypothetical protein
MNQLKSLIKFFDDNLVGQKGLSRYLDPKVGWSRDIDNYDIAIYTDQKCFNSDIDPTKINYAWIIEPPIINGTNHINISKSENYNKFVKVFSYNRWIGDRIPNFEFVAHGGTWLREEDIGIHNKNKLCSMIFSSKQWNAGHTQRLRVYNYLKDSSSVDFFGSGVDRYLEYKIEGLKDYMFSICMENEGPQHLFSSNTDYFSEKFLDCLLTGTIPIYYGNKSIANYFDMDGILWFDDPDNVSKIISNISPDLYISKLSAIKYNFEIAKQYIHPEKLINSYVQ